MKQLRQFYASILHLLIWHVLLSGQAQGTFVTFYFSNKCAFPIWPAIAPNAGHPVIAGGGFSLPSGNVMRILVPFAWTGRFWARTGCDFTSNWKAACETGDCDGRLACNGTIGLPPATLVQIAAQADRTKPNFYDVSLVDGYNIPVSVTVRTLEPKCFISGCSKDIKSMCPDELKIWNGAGQVVACKSACLAFDLDQFCCRNSYGSPSKCKPSVYSKIFKDACPSYFSYAFDSPMPLVSCTATEYIVTFCPSKWGASMSS